MGSMTKSQKKRLVQDILNKSKKLYMIDVIGQYRGVEIIDTKDMSAIERMCKKWMKRIG